MPPHLCFFIIFNKEWLYRVYMHYLLIVGIFIFMHCLVWISCNLQLIDGFKADKALFISIILAIPISLLAFWATKISYNITGSAWSVRLLAFGVSYLTFPILTWFFLQESPFNLKTMICIILSSLEGLYKDYSFVYLIGEFI